MSVVREMGEKALVQLAEVARLPQTAREHQDRLAAVTSRVDTLVSTVEALRAQLGDRLEALERSAVRKTELAEVTRHLPTILDFLTRLDASSQAHGGQLEALRADHQAVRTLHEDRMSNWEAAVNRARGDVAGMSELLHSQLAQIRERVEFIRAETMHEVAAGRARVGRDAAEVTPKILNEEKVKAMGDGLRLNLGCGHIPVDGYLNVDQRELPGVDVVAEVTNVPFEGVSELFSSHLIEHFSQEQLRRVVLPYWYGLLKAGGTFRAVLPDWESMLRAYSAGKLPFEDLREVTFGGQEYEGDFHFNMYSPDTLQRVLEEAGFTDVQFPAVGRANGKCLEMEVIARKRA